MNCHICNDELNDNTPFHWFGVIYYCESCWRTLGLEQEEDGRG